MYNQIIIQFAVYRVKHSHTNRVNITNAEVCRKKEQRPEIEIEIRKRSVVKNNIKDYEGSKVIAVIYFLTIAIIIIIKIYLYQKLITIIFLINKR